MSSKRPNFLLVLADDLGYSDIGPFGSEISTPNLHELAKEGFLMTNHHTAAACSPTRAMIMSGTDAHLGGLGVLLEHKGSPAGDLRWGGKPGYEGFLNKEVVTIAEVLRDEGYFTVISGKWHLGMRDDQCPWSRGFQKNFAMLPGCCNHYAWEPVLANGQAATLMGGRPVHAADGVRVDIPPNTTEDPKGFYSSDYYTEKLISFFENRSQEEKEKPFFAFLPYTAPHWPLQAPKSVRDKYRGRYDSGPLELRKARLAELVNRGIVGAKVVPHDVVLEEGVAEWNDMTEEQRALSCRSMEAYAAMVDKIDENVGKIVRYLKEIGEYDNTFIVFMSDNGAEGGAKEAIPVMGPKIVENVRKYYDNSLENIGAWNSYVWLGPLWGQASTAPSRLYKGFSSQGGILVPCIVKPPKNSFDSKWTGGSLNRSFTTCMDFAPTFCDMAGISLYTTPDGKMMRWRDESVHAFRGHSWVPYLSRGEHASPKINDRKEDGTGGETWAIYPHTKPIGWELYARAALRKGPWKIVHIQKRYGGAGEGDEGWELFDVETDPGETRDCSTEHPDKKEELLKHWDEYVVEMGVVWGPHANDPGLSVDEAPLLHEDEDQLATAWMMSQPGIKPSLPLNNRVEKGRI